MTDREEKRRKLREAANQSRQKADELLDADLQALRNATMTDLEALRPKMSDKEAFDKLNEIVKESTSNNESLAQLKDRLERAGGQVMQIAKESLALLAEIA